MWGGLERLLIREVQRMRDDRAAVLRSCGRSRDKSSGARAVALEADLVLSSQQQTNALITGGEMGRSVIDMTPLRVGVKGSQ
jgi:hypothetical protein